MLKNKKNKSYKQTVYLYTVCFGVYPCEVVCTDDSLRHPELVSGSKSRDAETSSA